MPEPLPVVAIVGRVNVGKSSLFNRLAGRRIAIEDPTPGVTRDRVSTVGRAGERAFELVDTGGWGLETDPFSPQVEQQVEIAIRSAALLILVVDARDGRMPLDERFARHLRERGRPVIVAANKADDEKHARAADDFARLGFDAPLAVSAKTGRGVPELVGRIGQALPASAGADKSRQIRIAIVGRRNVGKSTWVNAALGAERLIVSDIPGTTRDAVDVRVERGRRVFVLVDTAGLRKGRAVEGSVEFYAQSRALHAVESADAVLFLIDALEKVTVVDKQLSSHIAKASKPAVIVFNKWDLVARPLQEEYARYVSRTLPELAGSPIAFTSALRRQHVWETLDLAWDLGLRAAIWWDAAPLSAAVAAAVAKHPPRPRFRTAKFVEVREVRQVGISPVVVEIRTNDPGAWRPAELRMITNAIRSARGCPWAEIPIRLRVTGDRPARKK